MNQVRHDTSINLYVFLLTNAYKCPVYGRLHLVHMTSYTYLLLEGEKVEMEVHPDEIKTVAVSLKDGSIIYAVAGPSEERKLLELQMIFFLAADAGEEIKLLEQNPAIEIALAA